MRACGYSVPQLTTEREAPYSGDAGLAHYSDASSGVAAWTESPSPVPRSRTCRALAAGRLAALAASAAAAFAASASDTCIAVGSTVDGATAPGSQQPGAAPESTPRDPQGRVGTPPEALA